MAQASNGGQPPWGDIDLTAITAILGGLGSGVLAVWGAVKGYQAERRATARERALDESQNEDRTIKYAFELVNQLRQEIKRIREESQAEIARLRAELDAARARISELERINRESRRMPPS